MADFVYEIACTGDRAHQGTARSWFESDAAPACRALPGLSALDVYEPLTGGTHDPFVDDGPGPLLLAMLQFRTLDALAKALAGRDVAQAFAGRPQGLAVTGTSLERRFFPVAGEATAGPLRAPFSYVVRYHHPAQDAVRFVSRYLADHPPVLAKLPDIRSVLCYLPVDAGMAHELPPANYMIGNEVAFDSAESFNAAMASPVRKELRAHFYNFPPFTGRNTHYPMMRRQLTGSVTAVAGTTAGQRS